MEIGFDIGSRWGKAKERRTIFPVTVTLDADGMAEAMQIPGQVPNGVLVLFGAPRHLGEPVDSVIDRSMLCVDPLTVH